MKMSAAIRAADPWIGRPLALVELAGWLLQLIQYAHLRLVADDRLGVLKVLFADVAAVHDPVKAGIGVVVER